MIHRASPPRPRHWCFSFSFSISGLCTKNKLAILSCVLKQRFQTTFAYVQATTSTHSCTPQCSFSREKEPKKVGKKREFNHCAWALAKSGTKTFLFTASHLPKMICLNEKKRERVGKAMLSSLLDASFQNSSATTAFPWRTVFIAQTPCKGAQSWQTKQSTDFFF